MTTLHVFKVDKLSETAIDEALAALDVVPSGRATLVDKATLLREEFEQMETDGRSHLLTGACDVCGEVSSQQFTKCPFCGTGESGQSPDLPESLPGPDEVGDPPEPGESQDDTDVPPPDYAEQSAVDVATLATSFARESTRVNPGSLAEPPEVPKTQKLVKKPRGGKKGGSVAVAAAVDGVIEVPTPALDTYVSEVRRLHGVAGIGLYLLATKLADGETSGIWKTRLDDTARARYKTFRAFCEAELGFTGDYAYSLMRIRARYTQEEFELLGTTKLRLIAKVEDPQKHDEIMAEAKQGATRKEIEHKVHAATGNKPSTKGQVSPTRATDPAPSKPPPVKVQEPKKQGVTVVLLEGKKKFPLWAAPKKKGDEPRPAKRVVDKPWGRLPLVVNDVEVLVTVTVTSRGELEGWAEARRVDPTK